MATNVSTRVTPALVLSDEVTGSDPTPTIGTMFPCEGMEWLCVTFHADHNPDEVTWSTITGFTGRLFVSLDGASIVEATRQDVNWHEDNYMEFSIRGATHCCYAVDDVEGAGTLTRRVVLV